MRGQRVRLRGRKEKTARGGAEVFQELNEDRGLAPEACCLCWRVTVLRVFLLLRSLPLRHRWSLSGVPYVEERQKKKRKSKTTLFFFSWEGLSSKCSLFLLVLSHSRYVSLFNGETSSRDGVVSYLSIFISVSRTAA